LLVDPDAEPDEESVDDPDEELDDELAAFDDEEVDDGDPEDDSCLAFEPPSAPPFAAGVFGASRLSVR
jgi:hypothetical protein